MVKNEKDTAWMIRGDGTAIPCVQHIYGNPDCVEETVYAAEWLYRNTACENTKKLVICFLSAYALSLPSKRSLKDRLLDQINDQPYITLTEDFIRKIGDQLSWAAEDPQKLNQYVCDALNKEFMRTRYGGKYDTKPGNQDLYFRVSSETFSWKKAVRNFLQAHQDYLIKTVTVLFDEESTGKDDFLYDKKGTVIDHLPVKELEL